MLFHPHELNGAVEVLTQNSGLLGAEAVSLSKHWHAAGVTVVQRSLGGLGASLGLWGQPLSKYDLLKAF